MNVRSVFPVCTSHDLDILSLLPLANVFPSGLNATLVTPPICPSSVRRCLPVRTSHKRMVSSSLALASVFPSWLNATSVVLPSCPCSVQSSVPVCTSHTRTVLSILALANKEPSGLNATLKIHSVCPVSRLRVLSVSTSYTQIPMLQATAKRFPSSQLAIFPVIEPLPIRAFTPSSKPRKCQSCASCATVFREITHIANPIVKIKNSVFCMRVVLFWMKLF